MPTYEYADQAQQMIRMTDISGHIVVVEPGNAKEWARALAKNPVKFVPPTASEVLAESRIDMSCSKMQGILALGQGQWNRVLAYRNTASWAEQIIIDDAQDWHRTSQNIQFFQYLLGLTDDEVDALFIQASIIVS